MSRCCPHDDSAHHLLVSCMEVVHYPSEDYPCICHAFETSAEHERCGKCGHPAKSHQTASVCRPANGEVCGCQRSV